MIDKAAFMADGPKPTPEQNAYFHLNNWNGQKANAGINNMPFVLDPAMLFGQSRDQLKELMYQPKPAEEGAAQAQPQQQPQTPAEQMLGLLQAHPELLPVIMQQMQQQQQPGPYQQSGPSQNVGF